jgi:hypothetical protein
VESTAYGNLLRTSETSCSRICSCSLPQVSTNFNSRGIWTDLGRVLDDETFHLIIANAHLVASELLAQRAILFLKVLDDWLAGVGLTGRRGQSGATEKESIARRIVPS